MKLSVAIMAHPIRKESAERIQERLGGDVPIVYDQNPKPSADKAQRWATGRRAWEAADSSADFHMVIQDDVLVAENVLPALEVALDELGPDGVVSAYTGTGRPDQFNVMKRLQVDRKSTRLNSSHVKISYAVFCLKKKNTYDENNKLCSVLNWEQ